MSHMKWIDEMFAYKMLHIYMKLQNSTISMTPA